MIKLIFLLGPMIPTLGFARQFSIPWYKIAAGGGTSSNGQYAISGTIGQREAAAAVSGGSYSFTGGCWAIISVEQTPGAPALYISLYGSTETIVWQDVSGWTLQQHNNLATPASWSAGGGLNTVNGTNTITITSPTGNLFFWLYQP